jgi:hypothetical protein
MHHLELTPESYEVRDIYQFHHPDFTSKLYFDLYCDTTPIISGIVFVFVSHLASSAYTRIIRTLTKLIKYLKHTECPKLSTCFIFYCLFKYKQLKYTLRLYRVIRVFLPTINQCWSDKLISQSVITLSPVSVGFNKI